jgi:tetratricopeptide (TPR) repeat protein
MQQNINEENFIQQVDFLIQSGDFKIANSLFTKFSDSPVPKSNNLKIKLALWFGNSGVYEDATRAINLLSEVLIDNPHNQEAALSKAFIEYLHYGTLSDESVLQLNFHSHKCSYYLLSLHSLQQDDFDKYVQLLKISVDKDNTAVSNHKFLARYYSAQGSNDSALFHFFKAISNVANILDEIVNWTDINIFINENIRGTIMTSISYGELQSEYQECKKWR